MACSFGNRSNATSFPSATFVMLKFGCGISLSALMICSTKQQHLDLSGTFHDSEQSSMTVHMLKTCEQCLLQSAHAVWATASGCQSTVGSNNWKAYGLVYDGFNNLCAEWKHRKHKTHHAVFDQGNQVSWMPSAKVTKNWGFDISRKKEMLRSASPQASIRTSMSMVSHSWEDHAD